MSINLFVVRLFSFADLVKTVAAASMSAFRARSRLITWIVFFSATFTETHKFRGVSSDSPGEWWIDTLKVKIQSDDKDGDNDDSYNGCKEYNEPPRKSLGVVVTITNRSHSDSDAPKAIYIVAEVH